jgi:hypothetical protein
MNPAQIVVYVLVVIAISGLFAFELGRFTGRGTPCPLSGIATGTVWRVLKVVTVNLAQTYVLAKLFASDDNHKYLLIMLEHEIPADTKCFLVENDKDGKKAIHIMSLPQEPSKAVLL